MRLVTYFITIALCVHSFGQKLSAEEIDDLKRSSREISPSGPDQQFDFLKDLVGSRKIVMLGEFDHRVREANLIRNRIVRYLQENLDFDVILFESGIGELIATDMNKDILTSDQMTYGLIGYWRSPEFSDLMQFVKRSEMSIAGFDVQRTGRSFGQYLKELNVLAMAPTGFDALEERFTKSMQDLKKKEYSVSLKRETDSLINDYALLSEIWTDAEFGMPHEKIALKTLYNRMAYLTYFLEFNQKQEYTVRWNTRDSLMAENIRFLVEEIFPGRKVIVIGHNFHLSKYNEDLSVMGEYLKSQFVDFVTLATFAGSGEFGFNEKVKPMDPPSTSRTDLKHIIAEIPYEYAYYPIEGARKAQWVGASTIVNDTFINLSGRNEMTLSRHFDGLLLIKKVSPVTSID